MKAAVVHDFEHPPAFDDFERPTPKEGQVLVSVSAAALSNLVKAQAAGKHYSSVARPPFVPGVDGVGRLADGKRVYFAFPDAPFGAMAEQTAVAEAFCVALPDELDDVTAAAAANPGMSSWAALTERAGFVAGESVLVNGATGASGRLAIQVAKHLGARRVVATGRNAKSVEPLAALGADVVIPLDLPEAALAAAFKREIFEGGVDVVLDYLWGASAEQLLRAITGKGARSEEPRIRYVQIGALTGETIPLPASALRSSRLELLGSGLGSVSKPRLLRAIHGLMAAIVPAKIDVAFEAFPLHDVQRAWTHATPKRVVLTV